MRRCGIGEDFGQALAAVRQPRVFGRRQQHMREAATIGDEHGAVGGGALGTRHVLIEFARGKLAGPIGMVVQLTAIVN